MFSSSTIPVIYTHTRIYFSYCEYHLKTSVMKVKHSPLRIVLGWGTKMVQTFPYKLELNTWPVIINNLGICCVKCLCVLSLYFSLYIFDLRGT